MRNLVSAKIREQKKNTKTIPYSYLMEIIFDGDIHLQHERLSLVL